MTTTRSLIQVPLIAAVFLVVGFGLATAAAAPASDAASVYSLGPGRIRASAGAVVALIGTVVGGLALARSSARVGTGNGQGRAVVALALGLVGLVVGGLVVTTADGGLGTGQGLGGGVVAMVLGLIGTFLGGLALVRSRRTR